MSEKRNDIFEDEDEVFADKDEVFADSADDIAKMDELINKIKEAEAQENESMEEDESAEESKINRAASSPKSEGKLNKKTLVPIIIIAAVILLAFTNIFWYIGPILLIGLGIFVFIAVYRHLTRCPKCGQSNAMKSIGKKETGRRQGSKVERRAFTDKYGNKLKDSNGKEVYQEETVYGYHVSYDYYHKCKYCGYVKVTKGTEFEK